MGEENNTEKNKLRAALYVDGFNIYHPLHEFDEPFLKWLDLRALGEMIIPSRSQHLVITKYFSALRPDMGGSKNRHNAYINALSARDVYVERGHYVTQPRKCNDCGMSREENSEKQTDINMALAAVMDAQDDLFDVGYLLTADSDHAASFRVLRQRFPQKRLVSVLPPDRPSSDKIMQYADAKIHLNKLHIEKCLFPGFVNGKKGIIRRPAAYDPPEWWVPPHLRAK
ncbi:NYN domain-containing protein [Ruegeria meonggei]|uniref:6-hydroxy-3-succinoylpyridine 3-monooxygenase HspA n=1 Tax=Ruegeria meonggei TaxID=1446476 RepID=A0A1X7AFN0_9RHOB|nr:NYN domain-containing protein [Ruegeria meonggei]SLN77045.1 6-hydroxy-3-succinoylpyridine 3-monooxygenase HspA [Ruegeria meonggei]